MVLSIDDSSWVGTARRAATDLAEQEGLGDSLTSHTALVATELATNLVKHAGHGELHLDILSPRWRPGVEILAIDRGPGIANVERCLADGYSTSGTPGGGMGAVRRVSHDFDVHSELGRGTIVLSRIVLPLPDFEPRSLRIGVVARPVSGEIENGDTWAVRHHDGVTFLLVCDGLGHGHFAAEAAFEAAAAFRNSELGSPEVLLRRIDTALRGTRGAAVAVAALHWDQKILRFAGVGNIFGVSASPGQTSGMVSNHGTAGHGVIRIQEFTYPLQEHGMVILHSDGLATHWNLSKYAGLWGHHPGVVAAFLYREMVRGRDDACIVVLKKWGNE